VVEFFTGLFETNNETMILLEEVAGSVASVLVVRAKLGCLKRKSGKLLSKGIQIPLQQSEIYGTQLRQSRGQCYRTSGKRSIPILSIPEADT